MYKKTLFLCACILYYRKFPTKAIKLGLTSHSKKMVNCLRVHTKKKKKRYFILFGKLTQDKLHPLITITHQIETLEK